jgi:hypothetical protein
LLKVPPSIKKPLPDSGHAPFLGSETFQGRGLGEEAIKTRISSSDFYNCYYNINYTRKKVGIFP